MVNTKISPHEHRLSDAEMALAIMREDLNRALGHRTKYDAEAHNICLAIVGFKDGRSAVLAAYSNDSAIPESTRFGLNLVPNVYGLLPTGARFGCDGMAQFHTEPKLLNFLCANPDVRRRAFQPAADSASPPRGVSDAFFRAFVVNQRRAAMDGSVRLDDPENIESVVIASEIDCCRTCLEYSLARFRSRFADKPLRTLELGKTAGNPTSYTRVTIRRG